MEGTARLRRSRIEQALAVTALALLLMGSFVVMKPFLSSAMWAVVLCFSLWPVHRRLTSWMGNRRTLAAALTTFTITVVLLIPFVVIGFSLADNARALGVATRKWIEAGPPAAPGWLHKVPIVGEEARSYWIEFADETAKWLRQVGRAAVEESPDSRPETSQATPPAMTTEVPSSGDESRLVDALKRLITWTRSWLPRVGLAIGRGATEVALSVFIAFFILRDGATAADRLTHGVGRIAGERGKRLLEVAGKTVRGVVYGILGTALVQGGVAGIGFWIAGVPGAALLALATFFLSMVPVGPPMVWIPAVIWLFNQGSTGWAIFMIVWGLGVSSVDNLVKPWLISQGSTMPFVLIFFGVLGGALAFGVIGVFLGPTLLAVVYRLIEEWSAGGQASARTPPVPPQGAIPKQRELAA
ncbi:MAG: AI-2E family transporter [Verrucomicrobia bacterium]|nr:AI-2E family transporter [Verrucomicrobiota bacterium]